MLFGNNNEEFLYHYTSHETLFNIVETGVVWASNAYYMNDQHEVKYALNMLTDIAIDNFGLCSKKLQILLNEIPEWIDDLQLSPFNIFCFSLSENGNLLSQWRAYTPHGTGVSIGFSRRDIQRFADDNNLLFLKCCYDKKEQRKCINKVYKKIVSDFQAKYKSTKRKQLTYNKIIDFLDNYRSLLIKEAIKIKSSAFHEECEWRLVRILDYNYIGEKINFRPSKTTLIPYTTFNLKEFSKDDWLFDHVYVGPSPNFRLSLYAISDYTAKTGACQETINAKQPYREI